jgi:hypothetical protein
MSKLAGCLWALLSFTLAPSHCYPRNRALHNPCLAPTPSAILFSCVFP